MLDDVELFQQVRRRDLMQPTANRRQLHFSHQLVEVGARHASTQLQQLVHRERLASLQACFRLQFFQEVAACIAVEQRHFQAQVQSAGAGQCGVDLVAEVGGGNHEHMAFVGRLEPVDFYKQLVDARVQSSPTAHAQRVDFIKEDQTRRILARPAEDVADGVDLQQLRATGGNEGQPGFAGQCLGQHGLAGAGLAVQQHPTRQTELVAGAGVLEQVHHLGESVLDDVVTEDILESQLGHFNGQAAFYPIVTVGGHTVNADVADQQLLRPLRRHAECQALASPEKLALEHLRFLAEIDGSQTGLIETDGDVLYARQVRVLVQPLPQDRVSRQLANHQRAELWGTRQCEDTGELLAGTSVAISPADRHLLVGQGLFHIAEAGERDLLKRFQIQWAEGQHVDLTQVGHQGAGLLRALSAEGM